MAEVDVDEDVGAVKFDVPLVTRCVQVSDDGIVKFFESVRSAHWNICKFFNQRTQACSHMKVQYLEEIPITAIEFNLNCNIGAIANTWNT